LLGFLPALSQLDCEPLDLLLGLPVVLFQPLGPFALPLQIVRQTLALFLQDVP
jgi:hypothetical protein